MILSLNSDSNIGNYRKRVITHCECDEDVIDDIQGFKKSRLKWTKQLHRQFVKAISIIGIDIPRTILDVMQVRDLTKEQVASHLQKYRLKLRKLTSSFGNGMGTSIK
ncbi:hypothetical protein ZOSMA_25G00430 [Zostera marina]|uniref:HTH myb-type domain-containing protein n=1 Tax=Zostera marina TaxID=29655 RepID=A0A0K9PFE8_ZOSMR|nr:hypothetical protein ZOSMA_25G00430 [Zostera marina]